MLLLPSARPTMLFECHGAYHPSAHRVGDACIERGAMYRERLHAQIIALPTGLWMKPTQR